MTNVDTDKLVPVLLVEDDPEDVEITQRAFEKARITNPLYVVRDGQEAMEFLRHTGRYADAGQDAPKPGLILLDLNLPRLDGREVLKLTKEDADLHRIPIVVLQMSDFSCQPGITESD